MSLTKLLSPYFTAKTRQRGQDYHAWKNVRIEQGSPTEVEAQVRGNGTYWVGLSYEAGVLYGDCSCPFVSSNLEPCKHLWATLLTVEASGYLSAARNRSLSFHLDGWDTMPGEELDESLDESGTRFESLQVKSSGPGPRRRVSPPSPPPWKKQFEQLATTVSYDTTPAQNWPATRQILYLIDGPASESNRAVMLEVAWREPKKNGDWCKPKTQALTTGQIALLPEPDRQILALLTGVRDQIVGYYYGAYDRGSSRFRLTGPAQATLLSMICQTGRCFLRSTFGVEAAVPVQWDGEGAWQFWVTVNRQSSGDFLICGELRRGDCRLPLPDVTAAVKGSLVFARGYVSPLDDSDAFDWMAWLRREGTVQVPAGDSKAMLEVVLHLPRLPRLELPVELKVMEMQGRPQPCLRVRKPNRSEGRLENLRAELSFNYDGVSILKEQLGRGVLLPGGERFLLRDLEAEEAAQQFLMQVGFRHSYTYYGGTPQWELAARHLPRAARMLLAAGWRVEAEGKLYRQPGAIQIEVRTGIDWFELHGSVDYGDTVVKMPALLQALKRGENIVRLDDGSMGLLPEEWLRKYGVLAGLGQDRQDYLQFSRGQAGLLDALLAAQPEATCDAHFVQIQQELRRFEGIQATDPPDSFQGQLRGYQREGLGWLHFLERFGFGGCLADDMGLGKTVQVLALLEMRRRQAANEGKAIAAAAGGNSPPASTGLNAADSMPRCKPSLVVVPRSLVFNWKQEAARFTPKLRVLDYTSAERLRSKDLFDDYDLALSTYGTLRRDAAELKDVEFDYVILDEAQAIKNASTGSAKAARLLRAQHRLALSGTPVQNHLGELWSLFEFLNPGMLGSASVFKLGGAEARNPDPETRSLLVRALRPFILRRTKEQVAKELPRKLEQTIYCELEAVQRKLYNDMKEYYRQSLLGRIERDGIQKSKIMILEALLRLRQAACHPGLIDKKRTAESSAKLDSLLPQLSEVLDEGHKALVFSQFTSLLAIVRDRLEAEKICYLYLDGKTRDRAAVVERFQNDPESRLFLISLKAGGLGLNLTAAEYVFLLDPWWNPFVEAQAIDRTHRIGQTQQVFAYRLIARDTVEEKVLALQQTKRALADAIIQADNSLIRDLKKEDLELLLS